MLWVVAIFGLGAMLGFWFGMRKSQPAFGEARASAPRAEEPELPYFSRGALFGESERQFAQGLEASLRSRAQLFGKVRMEDMLEIRGLVGRERLGAQNRIKSRCVDFALCRPKTYELLAAIDFDDGSEKTEREQEGERFKEICFRAAGIRYFRFDGSGDVSTEAVRRWIEGTQLFEAKIAQAEPVADSFGGVTERLSRIGDWVAGFEWPERTKPRLLEKALSRREELAVTEEATDRPREESIRKVEDPSMN